MNAAGAGSAMRILYLLQDLPFPPTDGVRWKPYNLIQHMSRRHACDVLAFQETGADRAAAWMAHNPRVRVVQAYETARGLRLQAGRIGSLLTGRPLSVARWRSPALRARVREVAAARAYDVIHVDMLNLLQYLPSLRGAPTVCSVNDASSRLYPQLMRLDRGAWARVRYRFLWNRLARYERSAMKGARRVHVVSPVDAEYLRSEAPDLPVEVIGIAVDDGYFRLEDPGTPRAPTVLAIGLIDSALTAAPYVRFFREVWPGVRAVVPEAECLVLARGHERFVGSSATHPGGARFLSWVPDYPGTLARAHVCLFLDVAGTGQKNRVVQAMAAGKPVVGTPAAFEGIPVEHGASGLVCDSVEQAGGQVSALLRDAPLRSALGAEARRVAAAHFRAADVGARWEALYRAVADEGWGPA